MISLASILQQKGWRCHEDIEAFIQEAQQLNLSLQHYLLKYQLISAETLASLLADFFEVAYLTQETLANASLMPTDTHTLTHAIVASVAEQTYLIISHAEHISACTQLLFAKKYLARLAFTDQHTFLALLNQQHQQQQAQVEQGDEYMLSWFEQLLNNASHQNASDIHIEPSELTLNIRMRINGLLQTIDTQPKKLQYAVNNIIKFKANLDLTETRLPQDGRFRAYMPGNIEQDCRVSTCPTSHGEKIVIRLLPTYERHLSLEALNIPSTYFTAFVKAISKPQGLILVTGPTGSGKSTTLYTILNYLNSPDKNLMTIENPVEMNIPGLQQVNVNPDVGLTFASALKSFLRQDPDVIMIGEIRDQETAETAIKAAQTGHLVLTTLHTNDSLAALTRLEQLGIKTDDLTNSTNLIIAQRLLRRKIHNDYGKRFAIFELLFSHHGQLNDTPDITLKQAAQQAVKSGQTDLQEITRVLGQHEQE